MLVCSSGLCAPNLNSFRILPMRRVVVKGLTRKSESGRLESNQLCLCAHPVASEPGPEARERAGLFAKKFLGRGIASATGVCRLEHRSSVVREPRRACRPPLSLLLTLGPLLAPFFNFFRGRVTTRHPRARTGKPLPCRGSALPVELDAWMGRRGLEPRNLWFKRPLLYQLS